MSNRRFPDSIQFGSASLGREVRQEVREERLRPTAGLRGTPAIALSAWRGRSGSRYVVGVHDLSYAVEVGRDAVLIAVARNADGIAHIVHAVAGMTQADNAAWAEHARGDGATEVHVHRLAESASERAAVIADLGVALETEAA